jgi:hypothetical protein
VTVHLALVLLADFTIACLMTHEAVGVPLAVARAALATALALAGVTAMDVAARRAFLSSRQHTRGGRNTKIKLA